MESSRDTSKDISKEEREALRFRDIVERERDSEEDKQKGVSTWRNEDHIGQERSSKINKKYDVASKESKRPQTHSSYVTQLSDIINVDPSSYEELAKEK